MELWFDVNIDYYKTCCGLLLVLPMLWFDVNIDYYKTRIANIALSTSCGLM